LKVNGPRRAKIFCRLEDVALLPVIEGYLLDIIQGELSQVNLPVLGVTQLDAIVKDPHVVGTHASDVYRLEPPNPP